MRAPETFLEINGDEHKCLPGSGNRKNVIELNLIYYSLPNRTGFISVIVFPFLIRGEGGRGGRDFKKAIPSSYK